MFNLYQMVTGAQGGQGLENLAGQFGISRDQADAAVKALVPALSTAFMAKAAQPGGLGDIAGAMSDDHHRQAYMDPAVAQAPQTGDKGDAVAGSIFGNGAILDEVVAQAARYTGLPAATLRAMLPVVVSMVLGGIATTLHNQGVGGMLGQLAQGGLGNILSQFGGAHQPGGPNPAGGFGGMLGSIMNSFLGGAHPATPQQPPQHTHDTAAPHDPAAGLPPMVQAGLDMLGKMFQPGVAPSPAQPQNLGDKIDAASRR